MKVTVIVPTYNVSDYIERCVRSIMCQTYKGDIECILVDDCSPDDSIEKAERLIGNYQGNISFRIIHHSQNTGLSSARNTGIKAATGDYIYFLDSDDEITPDCIELMVNVVKQYPNVELVVGAIKSIPDVDYYHTERYDNIGYTEDKIWLKNEIFKRDDSFPCNSNNKLISTRFIKANNLCFLGGIIHEDQDYILRVAKCLRRVYFLPQKTYIRYFNPGSIMTTNSFESERSCYSWSIIIERGIDAIDDTLAYAQIFRYIGEYEARYRLYPQYYSKIRKQIKNFFLARKHYFLYLLFALSFAQFNYKGQGRLRSYFNKIMKDMIKKEYCCFSAQQ